MNQGQFIDAVHNNLAAQGHAFESKAQAERCVKACLAVLHDQMVAGENVRFSGFGTFSTRINKPREGRNPQTGKAVHIPATRVVKFVPGARLKKDVAAAK